MIEKLDSDVDSEAIKKEYLPDREASLIKKEYCRLKCVPTLPTSDPYLERNLTSKGGQANWCPSLGLWGQPASG